MTPGSTKEAASRSRARAKKATSKRSIASMLQAWGRERVLRVAVRHVHDRYPKPARGTDGMG